MARKSSAVKIYLETVTTPLQRGLERAKGLLKKFNGYVSKVGSALTSTFGMIGLGLGAAGIKSMISDLDKLAKSAKNLGVSGEYFQKLSFAADRSGVAVESVFSAFVKLKKGAGDAATGNKAMIDNFARLGLTVEDMKKLSPEQLFDAVVERLQKMKDPLERDSVAAALFGRNFAQLNVFLRDYKSLGEELEARGGIITNEQLEAAEKFDDMMTNIATTVKGIGFNSGFVKHLANLAEGLDVIAVRMGKNDFINTVAELANGDKRVATKPIAEREIAASGGLRVSREDALKMALSSGKLTGKEYQALNSGLAFTWASGKLDGHSYTSDRDMEQLNTIDSAMKRLGFGELAGEWGNKFGEIYRDSTYEQGNFTAALPDWAGGKEKREAARQKVIDDAAAAKEAEAKAKKAAEEAKKAADQKTKDDAITEIQKKSERESLRKTDPVAAKIADFVDKYGEISADQRSRLSEIYGRDVVKEEAKAIAEEAAPVTGGVMGQFGADMIERSFGGADRLAERTADATEKSAKILTDIRNKNEEGLHFT